MSMQLTPPKTTFRALFVLSLAMFTAPLLAQHGTHTHGKAELNLVLNSDRELIAELISPAESVYGFEHEPRNAEEAAQIKAGLKRLQKALPNILIFEQKAGCKATQIDEDGYFGAADTSHQAGEGHTKGKHGHDAHGHAHNHKKSHHHAHKHGEKHAHGAEHGPHRNVVIRWRVQCDVDLPGARAGVKWEEALNGIHHVALTLLTPTRQEAIPLKRSGEKIRF